MYNILLTEKIAYYMNWFSTDSVTSSGICAYCLMTDTPQQDILPEDYTDLLQFYDRIDIIYIFLLKRRVKSTIKNISDIFSSTVERGKYSLLDIFDKIRLCCIVCPDLFKLINPTDNGESKADVIRYSLTHSLTFTNSFSTFRRYTRHITQY